MQFGITLIAKNGNLVDAKTDGGTVADGIY